MGFWKEAYKWVFPRAVSALYFSWLIIYPCKMIWLLLHKLLLCAEIIFNEQTFYLSFSLPCHQTLAVSHISVCLKHTSLLNSWWTHLKRTNLNYFSIIFINLRSLKVKISPKVYLKYTSYLEYRCIFKFSSISAEEDTNRSSHNLWSNDLVIGHRSTKPKTSGSKP